MKKDDEDDDQQEDDSIKDIRGSFSNYYLMIFNLEIFKADEAVQEKFK